LRGSSNTRIVCRMRRRATLCCPDTHIKRGGFFVRIADLRNFRRRTEVKSVECRIPFYNEMFIIAVGDFPAISSIAVADGNLAFPGVIYCSLVALSSAGKSLRQSDALLLARPPRQVRQTDNTIFRLRLDRINCSLSAGQAEYLKRTAIVSFRRIRFIRSVK